MTTYQYDVKTMRTHQEEGQHLSVSQGRERQKAKARQGCQGVKNMGGGLRLHLGSNRRGRAGRGPFLQLHAHSTCPLDMLTWLLAFYVGCAQVECKEGEAGEVAEYKLFL